MEPIFPMVEEPRHPVVSAPRMPFYDRLNIAGGILMRLATLLMVLWFFGMIGASIVGSYASYRPYHYLSHVFAIVAIVGFQLWWTGQQVEFAYKTKPGELPWSSGLVLFMRNLFVGGLMSALLIYMIHWTAHDYRTMGY